MSPAARRRARTRISTMIGQMMTGRRISFSLKDLVCGLLFRLVAALFATSALRHLPAGSARNMGPGYCPLMVTVGLAAVGIAVVVRSFARQDFGIRFVPLKSLVLTLSAPFAFAITVKPLGFVAAVALTVFISAWASRRMTLRLSLSLSLFLTILSAVLFHYLLRMPVALLGPWLTF
jgi:hypothetical protein